MRKKSEALIGTLAKRRASSSAAWLAAAALLLFGAGVLGAAALGRSAARPIPANAAPLHGE